MESTIIIGPSKSVLVHALHSLQNVLGLGQFWVFVSKFLLYIPEKEETHRRLLKSFIICMVIMPQKKYSVDMVYQIPFWKFFT